MLKQLFHKSLSLFMALVVLGSTLSFTINLHYCGDKLVETALFQKAKGCGMETIPVTTKGDMLSKKSCCSDKQLLIDGQDELQVALIKTTLKQQTLLAAIVCNYINVFESLDYHHTSPAVYSPPRVEKHLYKTYESYLI